MWCITYDTFHIHIFIVNIYLGLYTQEWLSIYKEGETAPAFRGSSIFTRRTDTSNRRVCKYARTCGCVILHSPFKATWLPLKEDYILVGQ